MNKRVLVRKRFRILSGDQQEEEEEEVFSMPAAAVIIGRETDNKMKVRWPRGNVECLSLSCLEYSELSGKSLYKR